MLVRYQSRLVSYSVLRLLIDHHYKYVSVRVCLTELAVEFT